MARDRNHKQFLKIKTRKSARKSNVSNQQHRLAKHSDAVSVPISSSAGSSASSNLLEAMDVDQPEAGNSANMDPNTGRSETEMLRTVVEDIDAFFNPSNIVATGGGGERKTAVLYGLSGTDSKVGTRMPHSASYSH